MTSDSLSHSYQSEHSPRGAAASFSLGRCGEGGGFSLNSGKTGEQDVFIGYFQDGQITCLPYNSQSSKGGNAGMAEFIPTGDPQSDVFPKVDSRVFTEEEIRREYRAATDTFRAGRVEFSLVTPTTGIPDPAQASHAAVKEAVAPVVTGQVVFDNTDGSSALQGFFAVGDLPGFRQLDELTGGELAGVVTLGHYGFATPNRADLVPFSDMFLDFPFRRPQPNRNFLSGIGGFAVEVPAGEKVVLPLAFGWFQPGLVTLGKECVYYYTKYFANLTDVLVYGLEHATAWREQALADDRALQESGLNEYRQWLWAKSLRSYWGNTQLFAEGDRPRWVVNEGSCNMINTLDLAVDMAFFEAQVHPWLLRNVLDASADEYRYTDTVHDREGNSYPGGVSFTHDHGYRDVFSRPNYSHYEAENHPGCFSYMTCEELLNWVLSAAIYFKNTQDTDWLHTRAGLLGDCLQSLLNRDHPDPAKRNGMMGLDSDRCGQTEEITTYDSLDPSLGQARNNTYMGMKLWGAYLALEQLFTQLERPEDAAEARKAAERAAATVTGAFDAEQGFIPAILEEGDRSAIIPIIEGLAYPKYLGLDEAVSFDGPFGDLLERLKVHLKHVLHEGRCLFPDGGWKLSGNNDNSWMSKIFLNQYAAEQVLGFPVDEAADKAHDHWWRVGCARQSVVDQVIAGKSNGRGSTYPRTVSAILWFG